RCTVFWSKICQANMPGMRAGPMPVWRRAEIERHAEPLPGVEAAAAHLRQIPARPEIAGAHLGIGLAPAASEHDGARAQIDKAPLMPYPHAADPVIALQQRDSRR